MESLLQDLKINAKITPVPNSDLFGPADFEIFSVSNIEKKYVRSFVKFRTLVPDEVFLLSKCYLSDAEHNLKRQCTT